jgi:hypothetical protein
MDIEAELHHPLDHLLYIFFRRLTLHRYNHRLRFTLLVRN